MFGRISVFAVLVALASAAAAAPAGYWAVSPTFDQGAEVTATSADVVDASEFDINVASLRLPAGSYMVTAKLSAWTIDGYWGDLQCSLATSNLSQGDYSSFSVDGGQKVLFMQAPVTFSSTTRIYFKCHLCGTRPDGSFKTATLWGAKIYAVQMTSLTKQ